MLPGSAQTVSDCQFAAMAAKLAARQQTSKATRRGNAYSLFYSCRSPRKVLTVPFAVAIGLTDVSEGCTTRQVFMVRPA